MGNVFKYSSSKDDYLYFPPTPSLHCLIKCKFYLGKPYEISSFLLKFSKKVNKIYTDKHNFHKLTKNTVIDGKEELIFSAFSNSKKLLNLIEFFGAVIIYSASSWEQKCEFSLKLRDFDKNEVISKDEMFELCFAFVRSIGIMSRIPLWRYVNKKKLENECNFAAEKHPGGVITILELKEWVSQNQSVLKLLQTFRPKKKENTRFFTQDNTIGSSFNSSFHSSFIEKNAIKKLKRSNEAASELSNLYSLLKSQRKRITVARIFQEFIKSVHFKEDANYLYNLYHFKLSNELTLEELVDIINKRPIMRKSFFRKRNLSMGTNINESKEFEEKTENKEQMEARTALRLEKIFDRFDVNHDGRVDFKELKKGLKQSFDKIVIKDLYSSYVKKGKSNLGLREFIEMFAPVRTEITDESLRHVRHRLSSRVESF